MVFSVRQFGIIDNVEKIARREDTKDGGSVNVLPEYDVVIVGGGTAGCVLASRISENPEIKVLLLEAGGSGKSLLNSRAPGAFARIFHTKHDYEFYTAEQHHADGRKRFWPRGKMLGGCSSINAQIFHLGAPSDYDEWAKSGLEGAEAWRFDEFQKYFLKFEKFSPHKLYPQVDPTPRGNTGPVDVGYYGFCSNFSKKWLEACEEVGIPHSHDINTKSGTLGATKFMTYIDKQGRRVSTETAYLTPDVLKRENLTVVTHAFATKIHFDSVNGKKRAVAVEFSREKGAPGYKVPVRVEVVISAGAIHTPQILMLSGVGPADHLKEKSIPVVHDLPGVGKHLMDHPTVNLGYQLKRGESLLYLEPRTIFEQLKSIPRLLQWLLLGTGPVTSNIGEAGAFIRTDDPKLFPPEKFTEKIDDSTSGPGAPDVEYVSGPFFWREHNVRHPQNPIGDMGTIFTILLRPTSLGIVTLNSADPFDKPLIDPNYLSTTHDLKVLTRGVQLAIRTSQAKQLQTLFHENGKTNPVFDHTTTEDDIPKIEKIIKERLETLYHPTSTARMAKLEDGGVVDAYLRVHGLENVRIADASVFPSIISGHTSAPVIAIAERVSDLIKADFDISAFSPTSKTSF